jgi:ribosomal protein S18 acetylase RimI-like enzyme
MTLGVIESYRRLKIGSYLLKRMLEIISKMNNVLYVCLHVQTTNAAAVEFYKRHGFHIDKTVFGYYASNKIDSPDAYFLKRSNKILV